MSGSILILMAAGWVAWFAPFDDLLDRSGTPLGADFSMFYTAGRVASSSGHDLLYSQAEHQRQLHQLFPNIHESFCLPYRYPPFVAEAMSILAQLPYGVAYFLFMVGSAIVWWMVVRAFIREFLPPDRNIASVFGWGLMCWPVAIETLIGGQASMITAAIAGGTLLALRRNQPVAAGAILALALFKPNVLGLLGIGLLCRYPRMLLGVVPGACVLLGVSYFAGGWQVIDEYGSLMLTLSSGPWDVETPFWKIHSLAPLIDGMTADRGRLVSLFVGIVLSVAIGLRWRNREMPTSFIDSATALLVINSLFNPYTPIYDLVLLGLALIFLTAGLIQRSSQDEVVGMVQGVFAVVFFGPHLSQSLAASLGTQLFPLGLLAIAGWIAMRRMVPSAAGARMASAATR